MQPREANVSELRTTARASVRRLTAADPNPTSPHILIADSNADSRANRQQQLSAAGYRVSVARTGFEAIVKASCHIPDLIVIDPSLGDIDAEETGRLLTTCPVTAHIPVVTLSPGRRVPMRALTRVRRAAAV